MATKKPGVDVFIATIDQPCFQRCLDSLEAQDYSNYTIQVIRNVEPMCEAFNRMIEGATAPYWVQVDEDFILNRNAISRLVESIESQPKDVLCVCADLYDTGRERQVQGVKIYRSALMRKFRYRNIVDCEMEICREWQSKGFRLVLTHEIVGQHSPDYDNHGAFMQMRSQYEKQRKAFGVMTDDLRLKLEEWRKTGDEKTLFQVFGAVAGISTPSEHLGYERDKAYYQDEAFERLEKYVTGIKSTSMISHTDAPTISVIMPVYHPNLAYLTQAVDSIRNQTFRDWEFIIIGYETGGEAEQYLRGIAKASRKIKYIRTEQRGIREALNLGIGKSTGRYIARQDADDISDENRLMVQYGYLKSHPEVGFCGSSARVIDAQGRELSMHWNQRTHEDLCRTLQDRNTFTHGSVMVRGDLLKKALYSTEPFATMAEDYELWCRLITEHKTLCCNIPLPLYSWRYKHKTMSIAAANTEKRCCELIRQRYEAQLKAICDGTDCIETTEIINEALTFEDWEKYAEEVRYLNEIRTICETRQVPYNIDGLDNELYCERCRWWEYAKGMHLTPGAKIVLDAGSGFSLFPLALAKTGKEVHSIDLGFLDTRIWQAAKLGLPVYNYVATFQAPPFPDDYFDAVYCVSCLEHQKSLDEVHKALSEFKRVLRPGGLLYITIDYHKTHYEYGTAPWENGKSARYWNAETLYEQVMLPSGMGVCGNHIFSDKTDWNQPPLYGKYTFAAILLQKEL